MGFFSFLMGLFGHHAAPVVPTYIPPAPLSVPAQGPAIIQFSTQDVTTSYITTTRGNIVVTVQLTDDTKGAWVRLLLPDGKVSLITRCPAGDFLGLGGNSAHRIDFDYLSGIKVQVASDPSQPFGTVAYLR